MQRSLISAVVVVSVLSALIASPVIARDPVVFEPDQIETLGANNVSKSGIHHADKLPRRGRETNALTGVKHWVILRCKYQTAWGTRTPTQLSETFFNELFGTTTPNLGDYWKDVSYSNISITRDVPGTENEWRNMPNPNSSYGTTAGGNATPNITASFDTLFSDCASVWNAEVTFSASTYYAITLDDTPGACGVGGNFNLGGLDGQSYVPGTLVGNCQDDSGLWAHEMAHAFGLPHSESPNSTGNTLYNTAYDVLSAPCGNDGLLWNNNGSDPRAARRYFSDFGCLPSHLLSWHKKELGWIPESRIFRATSGAQAVTLERIADPQSSTNPLMAVVEVDSNTYFTVEARFKTGISTTFETDYDENIPGPNVNGSGEYTLPCCWEQGNSPSQAMVVINLITWSSSFGTRIRLQGTDDNNNGWWDDPGTQWTVGETFNYSGAANVAVQVNSIGTTSFNLTITRSGPTCNSAPFNDVPTGHQFCSEIKWMKDQAISTGFDGNLYKPGDGVTRQAMSAFMARVAGFASQNLPACTSQPFDDVPTNHPFCKEIKWMKDNNISTGFPGNLYKPNEVVTRQAMSAFMARLAGVAQSLPACSGPPFPDVATNHPFCKEIKWMKDANISTGFQNGLYQPGDVVTRQAMSAFMFRVAPYVATP